MSNFRIIKLVCCVGIMCFLSSCQQKGNKIDQLTKIDTFQKKESETLVELEIMPQYPGGEFEMLKFIEINLNKSIVSDSTLIEGKVLVAFSVDTIGKISDFTVIRTYNQDVDKEFLRVLKLMPQWKSGESWSGNKNDSFKKTKVRYTIPLKIPFKGYEITE